MRLIHFSDIHAACWLSSWRGYFDKRLLGALNYLIRRKARHRWEWVSKAVQTILAINPNVVVCSGDITSISDPKEFDLALAALDPLSSRSDPIVIYVPGNHDHYVHSARNYQVLERAFHILNQGRWQLSDLPLVYECAQVQFILVNEAAPATWFMSNGRLSEPTRRWWETQVSQPASSRSSRRSRVRILVGHFPLFDARGKSLPWQRRCHHNEGLQQALRTGQIDLSLCGHIHEGFLRAEPCQSMEICAGSLTATGRLNQLDIAAGFDTLKQRWISL